MIALIIPKAFIFANGCWPVAISNYINQIIISSKKMTFFFTVESPNAHISDRIP
jgi:hypothetical protein